MQPAYGLNILVTNDDGFLNKLAMAMVEKSMAPIWRRVWLHEKMRLKGLVIRSLLLLRLTRKVV
ncbi:hypothetical protein BST96_01375 [Oceanicoccus sagamiensis]|uniref:Uncharacterized protein n=1 Tax=Oceanicoccus sagamiensis TaxID=716816 RepID=A0A1X9N8V7_9GAMM|nr:hypothetical protein BST96_01375 [Oceanicoccus sagamiensis]